MDTNKSRPTTTKSNDRRRLVPIVDAHFQWKYTLIITAIGVGITAVMGALLFRAHADNTRLLELEGDLALQQQVMRGDQMFFLYLIILIVVMALALALWGLVVTHRVSGPLYVIARHFITLAEGRYPDLRPLRKHDELQSFFATFEEAVNALRDRDREALDVLDRALGPLKKTTTDSPAVTTAIADIDRLRDALAESIRTTERDAPRS